MRLARGELAEARTLATLCVPALLVPLGLHLAEYRHELLLAHDGSSRTAVCSSLFTDRLRDAQALVQKGVVVLWFDELQVIVTGHSVRGV